jgi:ankyrin repeat protein
MKMIEGKDFDIEYKDICRSYTALIHAAINGRIAVVKKLIAHGAKVKYLAIYHANKNGHKTIAKFLKENLPSTKYYCC